MKMLNVVVLAIALSMGAGAGAAHADPVRLSQSPKPLVTAKNVSLAAMSNAIVGFHMQGGLMPVRQDTNVIVYESELGFWQSVGVQMAQGNSGWQKPKGLTTFTMAQVGEDVMVSMKFETVATNMFNASNSVEINNVTAQNEQYLLLQWLAGLAEGRITKGDHNALGITAYEKPSRKTRKVGYVIKDVVPGGPAQTAGLAAGDVITHIGGVPLAEMSELSVTLLGFLQPQQAELDVQGKGRVVVTKRPGTGTSPTATPTPTQRAAPATAPVGVAQPLSTPKSVHAVSPTTPAATAPAAPASWWDKQRAGKD
jgi:hypothetical protein